MVARVPLIPQLDPPADAPHSHVWAVVLTGDAPPVPGNAHRRRTCHGERRSPALRGGTRDWRLLERASHLAPPGQVVAVLTRRHAAAWEGELAAVPQAGRVVQPVYRGRAAEALLPLLKIARQDPSAIVVVLPGDHWRQERDARLPRYVARAVWAAALRPDLPILLGTRPLAPVSDGWIEAGPLVEGLEALAVRVIERFVDGATPAERRRLFEDHALTSTSILVGRATTLLARARRALPDVVEALEPLERALGRPEEALLCEAVYESMPHDDLTPLERAPDLAVLAPPGAAWRVPEPEVSGLLAS